MASCSSSAALRRKEISCTAHCYDNSATCRISTVIAIEDVHWADEATLDLLSYLGRRIQHLRVLLLVTYRDDALVRQRSAAAHARSDWQASERPAGSTCRPLSTAGVATLAQGTGSTRLNYIG